jgi:hypothetical protein
LIVAELRVALEVMVDGTNKAIEAALRDNVGRIVAAGNPTRVVGPRRV